MHVLLTDPETRHGAIGECTDDACGYLAMLWSGSAYPAPAPKRHLLEVGRRLNPSIHPVAPAEVNNLTTPYKAHGSQLRDAWPLRLTAGRYPTLHLDTRPVCQTRLTAAMRHA